MTAPSGLAPPRRSERVIIIVGAGFAGTALAAQLLRTAKTPTRIVLAEKTGVFSRGVAYSTTRPTHRLNVAAGRMGAFPDNEGHFLEFLRRTDPAIPTGAFVPRSRYGQYLASLLDEARQSASPDVRLDTRADRAVALDHHESNPTIRFDSSSPVTADRVVLAIGNPPPADPIRIDPALVTQGRYVSDPWRGSDPAPAGDQPVALIGTGLTMFDVALDLVERGHTGPIIAVSRRGIIPTSHRSPSVPPAHLDPWNELSAWDGKALSLLRLVRHRLRTHPDGEWREVINSLRPLTQRIWKAMAIDQRRRFLDHIRPFWESARHRAPDDVGAAVRSLIDSGRLQVIAARLLSVTGDGQGVALCILPRAAASPHTLHCARVINCTGPRCDYATLDDSLTANLLSQGLIVPDPLRLGLETAPDGALLDRHGQPSGFLFTLGPPRRPALWETTAVPEIRTQARDLAARLLQD